MSGDEQAVREVVNAYAETWNRHDIAALGALLSADADFVQVAAGHWRGRDTIERNVAYLHGTTPREAAPEFPAASHGMFRATTYRFERVDVRFLRPDVALAHVEWTQLGDARFAEPRRGVLSFVVTREGDGRWLLAAGHNTARP